MGGTISWKELKSFAKSRGLDLEGDKCPDCGEEFPCPGPDRCICKKPLMIVIPPGQHIHIQCPVHGDVKIYGSGRTYCNADSKMYWERHKHEKHYTPKSNPFSGHPIC